MGRVSSSPFRTPKPYIWLWATSLCDGQPVDGGEEVAGDAVAETRENGTAPGTCLAAASFAFAGEAVVGAGRFSYTTTTTGFCCSGCGCVGGGVGVGRDDDDEEEGKAAQNALRSSSA
uniref:Uncharacterized protein n=1 Tax=Oryza barthii TaxID=65489 RepID=A0A0D3GKB7_9ORYZ